MSGYWEMLTETLRKFGVTTPPEVHAPEPVVLIPMLKVFWVRTVAVRGTPLIPYMPTTPAMLTTCPVV